MTEQKTEKFKECLTKLLNKHCIDNETGIPDFIIADNLVNHIECMKKMVERRDDWFGFEHWTLSNSLLVQEEEK